MKCLVLCHVRRVDREALDDRDVGALDRRVDRVRSGPDRPVADHVDVLVGEELVSARLALLLGVLDVAGDELELVAADAAAVLVDPVDGQLRRVRRLRAERHDRAALVVHPADLHRRLALVGLARLAADVVDEVLDAAALAGAALGPERLAVDGAVAAGRRLGRLAGRAARSAGASPTSSPSRTPPGSAPRHARASSSKRLQQMTPSCERLSPSLSGSRRAESAPREHRFSPAAVRRRRASLSLQTPDRQATEPPSNPTPTGMSSR